MISNIGLDRIKINNVCLKSLNPQLVKLLGGDIAYNINNIGYKVINRENGEIMFLEDLILNITGAGLSDDCKAMQVQINKTGGADNWTISMGINVPKLFYGTYEKNLSEVEEIKAIPSIIEKTCKQNGIEIDLTNATVTGIEANVNIRGNKFYKAMKLINECWKYSDNKVFIVDTKNNGKESLKLKLPTREVKVYRKDIQLEDIGHICTNKDITRIEVSTNHMKTMYQTWGSNKFLDMLDNFNQVENLYKNTIKNNIYKPFKRYCIDTVDSMYNLLEGGVKARDLIDTMGINTVVDLDLYKQAIVKHYKSQGKKNPYTIIRNNIKKIGNAEDYMGNIQKIEEFFKQVGLE